jgi:hypothetical protein
MYFMQRIPVTYLGYYHVTGSWQKYETQYKPNKSYPWRGFNSPYDEVKSQS